MVRLAGSAFGALLLVLGILAVIALAGAFWPVTIIVGLVGGIAALTGGLRKLRGNT